MTIPPQDDPLSPSRVTAHVIASIVMLAGGCLIDWLRKKYSPSFLTSVIAVMGELTLVFYVLGAIGKAARWAYNEWFGDNMTLKKEGLLRQFIPRWVDMKDAIKQIKRLRPIIMLLIALALTMLLFEWLGAPRQHFISFENPLLNMIDPYRMKEVWVQLIHLSGYLLALTGSMTALTLLAIVVTPIIHQFRKP